MNENYPKALDKLKEIAEQHSMANKYTKIIGIALLLMFSRFVYAQTSALEVTFIGNAGFHITDGKTNIYLDFPYKSGAYGYMRYSESELSKIKEQSIFIFTHKHADHYARKAVRKLNGKVYARRNRKRIHKLEKSIPDLKITSYKTKHRFSFSHYSYVIDWHGKKIFISGDTEHPETIGLIKNIDYAFVPTWILYYAREKNINIDAKTKVLYHLYPNEKIEEKTDANFIIFDKQGMSIKIPY